MNKSHPVIELKNVSFEYEKDQSAIKDASFAIARHSTTIIIGPNGSGKTTLLKLMMGLLEPTAGSVAVLGMSPSEARRSAGYVPQKVAFDLTFPLTVSEFLRFSAKSGDEDIDTVLEGLDIQGLSDSKMGTLSGGQLQRVLIARSLLGRPEILFLDEPASGIDIGGEQSFYDLIKDIQRERDITVVMVSHQIGLVSQFADNVVCVNKTVLSSGKPELKLTPQVIEKLFGENVAVHEHKHE